MKVLVLGGGGMLASDLVAVLSETHDCYGATINEVDITDLNSINAGLDRYRPEVVVNCAAYTQVDKAETDRETALLVNGIGVQNLGLACNARQMPLCHISTDYVFDGLKDSPYTPFDCPKPVNFYGESKLAGEKYLQWAAKRFYIIRTSWLYGHHGPNFVKTILRLASNSSELRVVDDQRGSPTWTVSLSYGIKAVIESGKPGIYHITDETDGTLTWYGFASEIVRQAGLNSRVIPISTSEYPTPAKRPRYSVLDMSSTCLSTGFKPVKWQEALERYVVKFPSKSLALTTEQR
ncbi:MAG: dTDP-4-dehydrorhamnose reductase [Nitrospirae bacterium]|nr:dTDP-4-dehydrorhamnose reductase [Nitrospirota bacterium]